MQDKNISPSMFIGIQGDGYISFGSGQPDLPPPERVFKILPNYRQFKYGLIQGQENLRKALSKQKQFENSDKDIISFISDYRSKGVKYTICTDISKDGMLMGPSTALYKEILDQVKIKLIASGGISTTKDIEKVRETGCEGVIIGKAVYEGKITLKELGRQC